jgi:hypothetical protein
LIRATLASIVRATVAGIVAGAALSGAAGAQTPATADPTLSGTVRDMSGAVMQAVTVQVFTDEDDEPLRETTTDAKGRFAIALPEGRYRVEVTAPAFTPVTQLVTLPAPRPLDVVLDLEPIEVAVAVRPDDTLTANSASSLTSVTLSGDELLDLPRDEAELAEYLLQLAGADATGDVEADVLANFIIDGFEDGRLPRPDQISQVIIDPNPLSADGRGPRIAIVTRPGSGRWRRSVDIGFADESLNARTPGEIRKEPRQRRDVGVEIEGPVIANVLEMSLEVAVQADDRAGNSLRAITPAGSLFQGVVQPQREREITVGAEMQLNPSHRLDVRFTGGVEESANGGIGGFTLPERASDDRGSQWSLEVSERMFRRGLTNSVRVKVSHNTSRQTPVVDGVAIDVADAFNGSGGTSRSSREDVTVRVDDNLRLERGAWNVQWTGRLGYRTRQSVDQDNYNGTFEFASLHDYCVASGLAAVNCADTAQIVAEAQAQGVAPTYIDARGRVVDITGIATTFTQAFGNSSLKTSDLSFNTSLQADRRFGQDASLRLGLRYQGTNHSRDFLRFEPTVNVQYRPTSATVVSAGAQLTFADFSDYERLLRNDGSTHETEIFVSSPTFPDPFQGGGAEVGAETASLWVLSPDYRSPYTFSPQVSVTQQVPGGVRLTASYGAAYGVHQRRTPNINAPYPGTPLPEEILDLPRDERQELVDRMRPFYPHVGNLTEIQTVGRSVTRTLRLRAQPRRELALFGIELRGNVAYTYRRAEDDNDFDNPYLRQWGPTRRDHEVQSQFRIGLPDRVTLANPLLRAVARATYEGTNLNFRLRSNTGRLYSLRSGRDLNGDQSTRDRPIGVARNSDVGPGSWNLDMTLTRDLPLGGRGVEAEPGARGGGRGRQPDGPRVRFQARINNLLNRAQPRGYGSVVTSPLFGLPTGYTGGRTIDLSMSLDF